MRAAHPLQVQSLALLALLALGARLASDPAARSAGRVLFSDDFGGYELREFPHWWEREGGFFEIGEQGGDRVLVCLETGAARPKLPPGPLPAAYLVEIDFYGNDWGDADQYYEFSWVDSTGHGIGRLELNLRGGTRLTLLDVLRAHRELPAVAMGSGLHHLRIEASDGAIACACDGEPLASVSSPPGFQPAGFRIGGRINDEEVPCVFSSFRYSVRSRP